MQKTQEQPNVAKKTILKGTVVSDKMKDTIVVLVNRYVKHPKYKKYMQIGKRVKASDVGNKKSMGETVFIQECAPISKNKRFVVIEK